MRTKNYIIMMDWVANFILPSQVPLAQLTHFVVSSVSGYRSHWKTCDRSRVARMKSPQSSATAVKSKLHQSLIMCMFVQCGFVYMLQNFLWHPFSENGDFIYILIIYLLNINSVVLKVATVYFIGSRQRSVRVIFMREKK